MRPYGSHRVKILSRNQLCYRHFFWRFLKLFLWVLFTSPRKALQICMPPPVINFSVSCIVLGQFRPFFNNKSTATSLLFGHEALHSEAKVLSLRRWVASALNLRAAMLFEVKAARNRSFKRFRFTIWGKKTVASPDREHERWFDEFLIERYRIIGM